MGKVVVLAAALIYFPALFTPILAHDNEWIVGGKEAAQDQFPYVVNLYFDGYFGCGGSVLSKRTILTAAHCVQGTSARSLKINAGSIIAGKGITHQVSKIIIHTDYEPITRVSDIAILILETPLEFTTSIQPIEIDETYIERKAEAVSMGWGLTNYPGESSTVLRYVDVVTVLLQECRNIMFPYPVKNDHICSYSGSSGKGLCGGDSGGPLVLNGKIIGINSWTKRYCAKGFPDVQVRISTYTKWIADNTINE